MARRVFRPPLWATLVTPIAIAACLALGTWQLRRGDDRTQLRAAYAAPAPAAEALSARSAAGDAPRRVIAAGRYVAERTLLFDGQAHAGRPGRRVWTPLRLDDGAMALVDRGWIAQHDAVVPPPGGAVAIEGLWRALPAAGLHLASSNPCPPAAFPATVVYPTLEQLECLLGARPLAGLLLLDPQAPGGFVRDWQVAGMPPERHYAYAMQWFAFGLLAAILYVLLNLRRIP